MSTPARIALTKYGYVHVSETITYERKCAFVAHNELAIREWVHSYVGD